MLGQQVVNAAMLASIYMLVAVSFSIAIGILNFLNFSIPGVFMLSALTVWAALAKGASYPIAAVAALLVAVAASALVERVTSGWSKTADRVVPLVSSVAFLILFENLAAIKYGSDAQAIAKPFADSSAKLFGLVISIPQCGGLLLAVAVVAGLTWTLQRTTLGRAIRSIAEDPRTAATLGVDVRRTIPAVYAAAGIMTGLAGVIFATNYLLVGPFMGEEVGFKGISAMVIGGLGSIWGSVFGALIIALLEIVAIQLLGSSFVDLIVYGTLCLILVVRPMGLFGEQTRREKF